MSSVADSPLVRKRDMMQSCEEHGDCIVIYTGRACPLCLLADELDRANWEIRDMRETISQLEMEVADVSHR